MAANYPRLPHQEGDSWSSGTCTFTRLLSKNQNSDLNFEGGGREAEMQRGSPERISPVLSHQACKRESRWVAVALLPKRDTVKFITYREAFYLLYPPIILQSGKQHLEKHQQKFKKGLQRPRAGGQARGSLGRKDNQCTQ